MGAEGRITNGATVQKDDRGEKRDNVFSKLFFLQWEKWVGHQKVKKKLRETMSNQNWGSLCRGGKASFTNLQASASLTAYAALAGAAGRC